MTPLSFSIFYFIDPVEQDNKFLNFDEGGGEITAEVQVGSFTPTELMTRVETALNAAGTLTYAVSFNRTTRKVTISADSAFDLLVFSGSQAGTSIFKLLGFTGSSDLTGQSSYTGDSAAGFVWEPQFMLQDFVDPENRQEKVDATVNEPTSGLRVETVSFGRRKFLEFNVPFITDKAQPGGPIKNDLNGVANARRFLVHSTDKRPVEFMKDIGDRSSFITLLLERTPQSENGTGFDLDEMIDENLLGYFRTGILRYRVQ